MPACLFCGDEGPGILSNEHVVPDWLLTYLQIPPNDRMFQAVATSATGEITATRIHATHAFKLGQVCETKCNNGWMSRLETAAKSILIPLMDNQRPVESLTSVERAIVGKWASKTAYLHTWAGPLKNPVQLEHLRALNGDGGQPLPGVGVFGMQRDFVKPNSYFQTGLWPQMTHAVTGSKSPDAAYKIGVQFRRLYLLVAFWPTSPSEFVLAQNVHEPLVPSSPAQWTVLEGMVPPTDPCQFLPFFCNSLSVAYAINTPAV